MNIKNSITAFNFFAIILIILYLTVNPIGSMRSISSQLAEGSADDERIRKFILDNNDVVVEALTRYQEKKAFQEAEQQKDLIKSNIDALEKDPMDPYLGNKNGSKIVVEFFDYNCGHCKTMLSVKKKLIENKDVKIILKEVPIFGEHSQLLARASIAVFKVDPSKYLTAHSEFLTNASKYRDKNAILDYVKTLGLDHKKFIETIDAKAVNDKLQSNMELGRKIGLHGTPAYIVSGELVPGAVGYDTILSKFK